MPTGFNLRIRHGVLVIERKTLTKADLATLENYCLAIGGRFGEVVWRSGYGAAIPELRTS